MDIKDKAAIQVLVDNLSDRLEQTVELLDKIFLAVLESNNELINLKRLYNLTNIDMETLKENSKTKGPWE